MNKLDLMEAKIKLNDYLANAPKRYHCEGVFKHKKGNERDVDALVMAHTADQAKQRFVRYFTTDDGIAVCNKVIRRQGYIEKQGGVF